MTPDRTGGNRNLVELGIFRIDDQVHRATRLMAYYQARYKRVDLVDERTIGMIHRSDQKGDYLFGRVDIAWKRRWTGRHNKIPRGKGFLGKLGRSCGEKWVKNCENMEGIVRIDLPLTEGIGLGSGGRKWTRYHNDVRFIPIFEDGRDNTNSLLQNVWKRKRKILF
ncbi:MAG: hypothetical protein Q8Q69_07210 [Nitrosopumilaceae archaeon]|nr:hypothetical protein [Nitrosopumilaceae archaeon]